MLKAESNRAGKEYRLINGKWRLCNKPQAGLGFDNDDLRDDPCKNCEVECTARRRRVCELDRRTWRDT